MTMSRTYIILWRNKLLTSHTENRKKIISYLFKIFNSEVIIDVVNNRLYFDFQSGSDNHLSHIILINVDQKVNVSVKKFKLKIKYFHE